MSEKKQMQKILIPVLSKRESEKEFLEQLPENAKEIFLLLVIDTDTMLGKFGFAAGDIASGNALIQEIKKTLEKKGRKCIEAEEWGNTERKIMQLAQLKQADLIMLVKQENDFYKKLVKKITEETKIPTMEIVLSEKQKK